MHKFTIATAAALALGACGEAEVDQEPVVEETVAAVEPAGPMALDGGPMEGTYRITTDGQEYTQVVRADGTTTMTGADGVAMNGTWRSDASNHWCETFEGAEEACYTETIDEAGVWSSQNLTDPEDRSIIERID